MAGCCKHFPLDDYELRGGFPFRIKLFIVLGFLMGCFPESDNREGMQWS